MLDPVALGDALSLAAPGSEDVTIVSPIVVALTPPWADRRERMTPTQSPVLPSLRS